MALSRNYRAIKNAIFYAAKSNKPIHRKLKPYYDNIHRISAPLNILQMIMVWCVVMAYVDLTFYGYVGAVLIAHGASTIVSPQWQIWINRAFNNGKYFQPKKTEFIIFNRSIWYPSFEPIFRGRRIYLKTLIGLIEIIYGLYLIKVFY